MSVVFVLFFLCFNICFSEVYLCNSDSINEVVDNFNVDDHDHKDDHSPVLGLEGRGIGILITRIRRRLSWYSKGKKSGLYSSYEEYKASYAPKTSLWESIKEDIRKSKHETAKAKAADAKAWESRYSSAQMRADRDIAKMEARNAMARDYNLNKKR
jgi:hypothetical protein